MTPTNSGHVKTVSGFRYKSKLNLFAEGTRHRVEELKVEVGNIKVDLDALINRLAPGRKKPRMEGKVC